MGIGDWGLGPIPKIFQIFYKIIKIKNDFIKFLFNIKLKILILKKIFLKL